MSEVQDELERLRLKSEIVNIVYGVVMYGIEGSYRDEIEPPEAVDRLEVLFNHHAEKLAIDPHDFVEPCEPDCSPERHAYHQGQWDMAGRIQKHLGYMPYPGAIDAGDKLKEPQE